MTLQVGQLLGQRYRLVRLVGDGGMGSVYEARHELLGTTVAIKVLHPHLARREGLSERFLQEAQVSARIDNPHVVRASDVDRTSDGTAYLVMEYVEGGTLKELYDGLRERGAWLTRQEALDAIAQIFAGVEAAHAAGVVHRDLKPDNVMRVIEPDGGVTLKIMDFGLAKLQVAGELERGLTRPGTVMGTPEYMAPEQALSPGKVDHRADVFSLGVMLYELLSGKLPVERAHLLAIADAHMRGDVVPLDRAAPGVAPALARAVHTAMAPKPEDRFATVAELRRAVDLAASGAAEPAIAPTVMAEPAAAELDAAPPLAPAPKPRRRLWPLLALLAASAVAAVLAYSAWPTRARVARMGLAAPLASLASPAASAPVAGSEPALARAVEGSWSGRRVRIEHDAAAAADGTVGFAVSLARQQGGAWAADPLGTFSLSAEYYLEHRAATHIRGTGAALERYRFRLAAPRAGKYHLTGHAGGAAGALAFRCDICLGSDLSKCPGMRSCRPLEGGHEH